MDGGVDIFLGVVHDAAELVPVVDLLKLHVFNGSAGDYHAVKAFVLYIIKSFVELEHMLFGNVLYFMRGGLKQLCLDLNRRVAQQT